MRKAYLTLNPALLILSLLGYLYTWAKGIEEINIQFWARICWAIILIWSLYLMYNGGTFRKSNWLRITYFGVATGCIGMLFKLQHWSGSGLAILASCSILMFSYIAHFIGKEKKLLLDFAKAAYISSSFITIVIVMMHWPLKNLFMWITPAFGLLLFIAFYIYYYGKKEKEKFPSVESPKTFSNNDFPNDSPDDRIP